MKTDMEPAATGYVRVVAATPYRLRCKSTAPPESELCLFWFSNNGGRGLARDRARVWLL